MNSPDAPATTTPANTINLPPGVTIGAGRETTQTNAAGVVMQGTLFPVVLANGTSSSVFVPNSMLSNLPAIEKLFAEKVEALSAIPVG